MCEEKRNKRRVGNTRPRRGGGPGGGSARSRLVVVRGGHWLGDGESTEK